MIDNCCTLPTITAQYYPQNRDIMSKCKHFKIPSSTLVETGNGLISPLGLLIVPFEIEGKNY